MVRHKFFQRSRNSVTSRCAFICLLMSATLAAHDAGKDEVPVNNPPNIVFIYTDDQAEWTLGVAGQPQAETPNLDDLARQGVRFTNAFVTTPVCSPARAALMSGKYASEIGIHDFIPHPAHQAYTDALGRVGLDPALTTFAEVLAGHGYATGLVGKWHLGDWTSANDRRFHPTNHGFTYFMGLTGGGTTAHDPILEEDGRIREFAGFTDDILTDRAIQFIGRNTGAPFLLCINYRAPHSPWRPAPPEDEQPYLDIDPFIPNPSYPDLDVDDVKNRMRGYLTNVTTVDRNVGRVLDALRRYGLDGQTVVVFTSDHGFNMGHNGIWHKGNGIWATNRKPPDQPGRLGRYRPNLYDNSLRVPLIVRWPAVVPPGLVVGHTASNLDWYPTLLEMAGLKIPGSVALRGRSLLPALKGEDPPDWDNDFYAEYSMRIYARAELRAWRTKQWKLIIDFYDRQNDELYWIARDPEENINLIHDPRPEVRAVIEDLTKRILQRMQELGDPLAKEAIPRRDL
jgi:arylsulfatase A-like enzyme